ncbi:hypothetical protein QFZ82_000986 [Streptomyces sp. V4I23]|nr:hypothetical protein [Streptomyces sp. V4I23]
MARLRQSQRIDEQIGGPVAALVAAVQAERRAALHRIAAPSADRDAALRSASRRTDDAARRLRLDDGNTVAAGGEAPSEVAARLGAFVALAEKLGPARRTAEGDRNAWNTAYETYNDVVTAGLAVGGAVAGVQDGGRASDARVLLELDCAARTRNIWPPSPRGSTASPRARDDTSTPAAFGRRWWRWTTASCSWRPPGTDPVSPCSPPSARTSDSSPTRWPAS